MIHVGKVPLPSVTPELVDALERIVATSTCPRYLSKPLRAWLALAAR